MGGPARENKGPSRLLLVHWESACHSSQLSLSSREGTSSALVDFCDLRQAPRKRRQKSADFPALTEGERRVRDSVSLAREQIFPGQARKEGNLYPRSFLKWRHEPFCGQQEHISYLDRFQIPRHLMGPRYIHSSREVSEE